MENNKNLVLQTPASLDTEKLTAAWLEEQLLYLVHSIVNPSFISIYIMSNVFFKADMI